MTQVSIPEVTAKRTNFLVRVPSMFVHSVPRQPVRERERQREAQPAERCPRCHGLVWEVTDSVCVSVWRGNKTAERSRGRSSWPFVLPGSIKVNGKAGNLGGGVVSIERSKSKITVSSEVPFSKRQVTLVHCLSPAYLENGKMDSRLTAEHYIQNLSTARSF